MKGTGPDYSPALCCVCGQVRTLKITKAGIYRPPGFGYQTATCDLKCRHCKAITRHAVLTGTDWRRSWASAT
ncbi:hypothetical protein [uncultured Serinicoccus sp.]|uniref:hypothetical protein n=1 Tax=uncultured Serinicoccus sp. TaxID=735514 RepID=UPI0026085BC5|nr:hypothetical protein [uncultured Serinicoccus sp.]